MGRNVASLGPHSRPHRFWNLDGRTREGKRVRTIREELARHVGGKPNIAQALLIERASALVLRLELMDRANLAAVPTDRDTREFFYVQNTLTRTLKALGLQGAPERVPTIAELFTTSHAA